MLETCALMVGIVHSKLYLLRQPLLLVLLANWNLKFQYINLNEALYFSHSKAPSESAAEKSPDRIHQQIYSIFFIPIHVAEDQDMFCFPHEFSHTI